MGTESSPRKSFRFKQFEVEQSDSEMKVGFDGILLGAWADARGCERILDVGTGTGLVALMLAQRTQSLEKQLPKTVIIDAIDIDDLAAKEASRNFQNSPWHRRLNVEATSLQEFATSGTIEYDLIVCNPPYFASDGEASNTRRQLARHDRALDFPTLCGLSAKLLTAKGRLNVIVPTDRESEIQRSAAAVGFRSSLELRVRSLPHKQPHRVLLEFEREADSGRNRQNAAGRACETRELTIEKSHHEYTEDFKALAKDFYLAF